MTKQETFQKEFENHVKEGLTNFPKYLSSKYIYDDKGDKLFQQIMELPEYYLTQSEYNIIDNHKIDLRQLFQAPGGFDLIELGAGDGKKTKVLLKELIENQVDFIYKPIDISQSSINELSASLKNSFPTLHVQGEQGTYFAVLKELAAYNKRPKVILVLGSNIGNLQHPDAIDFLTQLKDVMGKDDILFMGFDQKKNPLTIQNAYSDSQGVTQEFNRNLLHRVNKEMDANFPVDLFEHWEAYNPETGTAASYLIATQACTVTIKALQMEVSFDQWETIHTEISQKYDDNTVEWLATTAGLQITKSYTDDKQYFKNYIFKVKA